VRGTWIRGRGRFRLCRFGLLGPTVVLAVVAVAVAAVVLWRWIMT